MRVTQKQNAKLHALVDEVVSSGSSDVMTALSTILTALSGSEVAVVSTPKRPAGRKPGRPAKEEAKKPARGRRPAKEEVEDDPEEDGEDEIPELEDLSVDSMTTFLENVPVPDAYENDMGIREITAIIKEMGADPAAISESGESRSERLDLLKQWLYSIELLIEEVSQFKVADIIAAAAEEDIELEKGKVADVARDYVLEVFCPVEE